MAEALIYAGIGSRRTPGEVLRLFRELAGELGRDGWALRTGGAEGADEAFLRGADGMPGGREAFLPWKGFRGLGAAEGAREIPAPRRAALESWAKYCHPYWGRCSPAARKLLTRNAAVLRGADGMRPADAVVCWTPNAAATGGTGHALRIARASGIPVLNAAALSEDEIRARMRALAGRPGLAPDQAALLADLRAGDAREVGRRLPALAGALAFADREGGTPAHHAAASGDPAMLWRLRGANAFLYGVDRRGRTAAHRAAEADSAGGIFWLARWDASLRRSPRQDRVFGDAALVEQRALDHAGDTPLHSAARSGRVHALTALLNAGADPRAVNRRGETPEGAAGDPAAREMLARAQEGRAPRGLSLGAAPA